MICLLLKGEKMEDDISGDGDRLQCSCCDRFVIFLTEEGLCHECFEQIDIKDYNIQLCKSCRMKQLAIINEEEK